MSTEAQLERRARALVIAKTVYKAVVAFWALAIAGMVLIWVLTTPGGYFWPVWPALGMGIAALAWGLALYGRFPFRVRPEDVEREMERLRRDNR
ncbi:2TM domain-containing protein [Myceligenerans indicum]|uniref:2TM domain-containing protein n=1 Tax=Myceligenerans indicum TaxID=2593663 RepID=A0ABS1LR03_9MICO|nr:2TM domain-containing protein [Myceligenerans indicum]MBL0888514.1 2TM domain-containing protein [Myceligenerans indicum]